ncbi:MAG: HAD family hydrolase, partial [Firmicutes bacterium]|nr:HAD family hydrolase [Bacillota bacterium]
MKFKAVIFDLDGTLVDSIDGIAISMNNVLKRHGFDVHNNETYKALVGHGMKELVKKSIFNKSLNDDLLAQYFMEMKEEYTRNWDYKMYVYEEIDELLHCLYSNGIYLAVNTNKEEDIARKVVERFFPYWGFSWVVGSSALMPKKPDQ